MVAARFGEALADYPRPSPLRTLSPNILKQAKALTMARPVYRRYLREFLPAMAAYMLIMFLLWPQVAHVRDAWLKAALALTPVLPMALVVRAMVRLVLGSDELEQRIHLIGLAAATAIVGVASMAGGFLAAAHVVVVDGTVLFSVFPALVVIYSFARSWAGRRYGGGGCCEEADEVLGLKWLVGIAVLLAAVALLGRRWLGDYGFGALLGTAGTLAAYALVFFIWRRLARRSASRAE